MTDTVILCLAACIAVAALLAFSSSVRRVEANELDLTSIHSKMSRFSRAVVEKPREPHLTEFNSAELAAQFYENANFAGLQAEEVTYSLEQQPGQPYQRYRIRLPVKADYPKIRRFLAALASDMPNVTLDSIRCERESTSAMLLNCSLGFSAFFRHDGTGNG